MCLPKLPIIQCFDSLFPVFNLRNCRTGDKKQHFEYDKIANDKWTVLQQTWCSFPPAVVGSHRGKIKMWQDYVPQNYATLTKTNLLSSPRRRSISQPLLPFRTVGDDVRLVGRAEAEVVQGEQGVVPVWRQVRQQLQGSGHPEDALLAVLCE